MLNIFAIQQTADGDIFRQQSVQANPLGLFSEQFMGIHAVFQDQFWQGLPENPLPVPTKISITMLSSGKVRLVNGRILLSQT